MRRSARVKPFALPVLALAAVAILSTVTAPPSAAHSTPAGNPGQSVSVGPYSGAARYDATSIATLKQRGVNTLNAAFVVNRTGATTMQPSWDGWKNLNDTAVINRLREAKAAGMEVVVSMGGEAGEEIAERANSAAELAPAYQNIVTTTKADRLDFDIEGVQLGNDHANNLRFQALNILVKQNPGLKIGWTIPTAVAGLDGSGRHFLSAAHAAGVRTDHVNIMTMCFNAYGGLDPKTQYDQVIMSSVKNSANHVAGTLGISLANAYSKLMVTPMLGVNNAHEVLTPAALTRVVASSKQLGVTRFGLWSSERDRPGPSRPIPSATDSGTSNPEGAYARALSSAAS